ncbi:hypothetical protein SteCoe_37322 [Stentor coeruleus]|uniref:Uncharacterized protein n=1 Tax=Stentor coeruleus TaxID=5963 RepID=A0A1R2ANA3_9CILI|nr:hypothetical protein SteCoe_37322 [Stentor coeruleus]
MSFVCQKKGCKEFSRDECTCMLKHRFCPRHMEEHRNISTCNAISIKNEFEATKKKCLKAKKMLAEQRKNLIKISKEMIKKINKMLKSGLKKIVENEHILKIIIETYNKNQIDSFSQSFQSIFFSTESLKETVKKSISLVNSDSKYY